MLLMPAPPYSSGRLAPSRPRSPKRRGHSLGNSPFSQRRPATGTMVSCTNSRTMSRTARSSGVNSSSIRKKSVMPRAPFQVSLGWSYTLSASPLPALLRLHQRPASEQFGLGAIGGHQLQAGHGLQEGGPGRHGQVVAAAGDAGGHGPKDLVHEAFLKAPMVETRSAFRKQAPDAVSFKKQPPHGLQVEGACVQHGHIGDRFDGGKPLPWHRRGGDDQGAPGSLWKNGASRGRLPVP